MYPTITIVTVVFNGAAHIDDTIRSVLAQTWQHKEYIIIDGGSTDGTKEKLEKYRDQVQIIISEKDKGIYDAMNKGIGLSNGDFTIFMNSGDVFYNEEAITDVFADASLDVAATDVIYGDTNIRHGKNEVIKRAEGQLDLSNAMPFCHQSVFIRTALLKQYLFNLEFRIIADREMITRIYRDNHRFFRTLQIVATIEGEGFSNQSRVKYQREHNRLMLSIGAMSPVQAFFQEKIAGLKDLVAGMMPVGIMRLKRRYKT